MHNVGLISALDLMCFFNSLITDHIVNNVRFSLILTAKFLIGFYFLSFAALGALVLFSFLACVNVQSIAKAGYVMELLN